MTPITVLIAEDHAMVREGLSNLMELHKGFLVVAQASSGRQAVALALQHKPQVIVMDIAMSGLNGFEATRQILAAFPTARILVLSAYSDDEYVTHIASLGAHGYVLKQNSGEVLLKGIQEVAQGRKFFSASILARLNAAAKRQHEHFGAAKPPRTSLTTREAEVLQLVAEGAPNKLIAATLNISIKTVEKHRQRLMDKLNIHDTAGLTRYAIATGVIESSAQETTAV